MFGLEAANFARDYVISLAACDGALRQAAHFQDAQHNLEGEAEAFREAARTMEDAFQHHIARDVLAPDRDVRAISCHKNAEAHTLQSKKIIESMNVDTIETTVVNTMFEYIMRYGLTSGNALNVERAYFLSKSVGKDLSKAENRLRALQASGNASLPS